MVLLLKEKTDQIVAVEENEKFVAIHLKNSKWPLRVGTKATLMLMKHFSARKLPDVKNFAAHHYIPKDSHQLEMTIWVAPRIFIAAKEDVHPHLIRMG